MVSIRVPVAIATLAIEAYLGFALIQLQYDKVIHFFAFFVLTVEFYFLFDTHNKALKTLRYVTFVCCTLGASITLEVIQHLVNPARTFDIYDIACNIAGSSTGLVVCYFWQRYLIERAKKYRKIRHDPELVLDDQLNDYVNIKLQDVQEGEN